MQAARVSLADLDAVVKHAGETLAEKRAAWEEFKAGYDGFCSGYEDRKAGFQTRLQDIDRQLRDLAGHEANYEGLRAPAQRDPRKEKEHGRE